MIRSWINILLMAILLAGLAGCKKTPDSHDTTLEHEKPEGQEILFYTCSMHPFIKQDEPGRCPICGMELVPVYADEPHPGHEGPETQEGKVPDRATLTLSNEKQQLIGVKTEKVERRPLIREIEASGRVAYDPDLFTAQNDYLIARRTGGGDLGDLQGQLVQAARSRLILLGMSEGQIRDLESRGLPQQALVTPQRDDGVWVYASLFESDFPFVSPGTAVEVTLPGSGKTLTAAVASIDPLINPNTRTAQARFKISNADEVLRPGAFLQTRIRANLGEVLMVPEGAVLDTGKRQLVYLKVDEGRFEPREIKLGRRGSEGAEVLSGLSAGDEVVTQGAFLLDSESSLKASHGGGHQH